MTSVAETNNMSAARFCICIILFWCLPVTLRAASPVQKMVLDNGMTVLIQPMPSTEMISIYAYVKTGSATEGRFLGAGISHFLEHMLFKGTARRGPGVISKEVKALGGNINASTSLDYTIYTIDLPKGAFPEGLDIISDMLMNAVIDPSETERERQVIHGEMRLYYDKPERRLSVNVFKNAYLQHPYRHPIIGYEPLFDSITRDDLYGYYKGQYIPNNIILSVAGAVDPVEIAPLIKQTFASFKSLPYPARYQSIEPPQISSRYTEEYYKTPHFRFSLAYQGMPVADPDLYAADVLAMALGKGEGARLYQEIYKKRKLVTSIGASNFTPRDRGLFEIEGMMVKDNLKEVMASVRVIVEDIKTRGLAKEELERTKQQVQTEFVFDNQTSSSLAYRQAVDEALMGDPTFSQRYVEAIRNVTNEDIKRVARKYLIDSSLSVTVVKPLEAKAGEKSKHGQLAGTDVQKIVFENGLTVLLKEDHTVGLVATQAVFQGGLRQETELNNGISNLFARVWTKGSVRRSEQQIVKDVESRGALLSAFSGRNSLGMASQVLSKDLTFALELMADLIRAPSFPLAAIKEQRDELTVAIESKQDDIRQFTSRKLMEILFEHHPYHMDVLGTKETLEKITRQDLLAYHARFIRPNNMVLSIFGDFDSTALLPRLQSLFGAMKPAPVEILRSVEPPLEAARSKEFTLDKEQAVVMLGFHAPAMTDKDRWPAEVLNTFLGGGLSGRLFVKVRDELGKAYTVGSYYVPGVDLGNIVLFVLTTNDKVDSVKEILKNELAELASVPISDEELTSLRSYIKGTSKMGLSTPSQLGADCAFNELYGLGYNLYQEYAKHIDGVTAGDIQRAAQRYMDIGKSAMVVTLGAQAKQ